MGRMFDRLFVLFVNDNGFVGGDGGFVNNVTKASVFASREEAEKRRAELYSLRSGFQNTISILEWL